MFLRARIEGGRAFEPAVEAERTEGRGQDLFHADFRRAGQTQGICGKYGWRVRSML